MNEKTVNHKRATQIVKQLISPIVDTFAQKSWEKKHRPDDVGLQYYVPELDGLEYEEGGVKGNLRKVTVTINDGFLELIGYEGNLKGFLRDYFGSDYYPPRDKPLKYRFVCGFLVNSEQL